MKTRLVARSFHMNRLFIADPSLKDIRGHHYMMTREATRSAHQMGFETIWLCSAAFSSALDVEQARIAPVFSASMYDAYIKQKQEAEKPGLLARLAHKLTGRPITVALPPSNFYEDLKSALAQWETGPQDRVLLHSADGESLSGVARLIQETPADALPVFHVATPYDPVGIMPKRQSAEGFAATVQELKKSGKLDRRLFLYAENAYLAEHLSALWDAQVRPLPIAASPPPPDAEAVARAALTEKLDIPKDSLIIISLGSARLEKGFHKIPDIAEELFSRAPQFPGAEEKIKFVLHASPQIVGRDPKITEAIEALAARPEEVILLLDPLSDEDYQRLLHASDIVLLPYGEHEYRVRGSAVVTEALAAGKTLVAAANTYPGKAAEAHGGLTATTAAGYADAILSVYKDHERYREQAQRESERFIAENRMENYWRRCLDAEREAGVSNG